jgi:glycosyltransferase involved in cell wall biosynthesis
MLARKHQAAVFHRAPGAPGLAQSVWEGLPTYRASAGPMTPWAVFRATFGDASLERAFARVIRDFRPDVIHVQHLMGLPASLATRAHAEGIPLVLTLHDFWLACANAQLLTNYDQSLCQGPRYGGVNCARCALARAGTSFLRPGAPLLVPVFLWRRRLLERVLAQAALIIAPSYFLETTATAWGIPAERLRYIPHGVDARGARPPAPRQAGPLRFAYIGGLAFQKGVHVLVEAFNGLERDATLEIYGDLTQFPEYAQQLQASASSPHITFGGRLDRNQVWQVLAEVDALILPSLWYENAPVVIQEAFAARVPMLVSDLGALAEWVRDGVDGRLVPPGDVTAWRAALRQLADDPRQLEHWQRNIRRPLTLVEHAHQVEAVYNLLQHG